MLKTTLKITGIDEEKLVKIVDKFSRQRIRPVMVFRYSLKKTDEAIQLEAVFHNRLALSELCRRLRIVRGCEAEIEKIYEGGGYGE